MAETLTAFVFLNRELPLPIQKQPKPKPTLTDGLLYEIILKCMGLESKRQIQLIIDQEPDPYLRKEIQLEINANIQNVFFVNPEEYKKYFSKFSYFDSMDQNIKNHTIDLSKQSSYLAELILLVHGIRATSQDKEDRVFRTLKKRFESASRANAEKNLRRITRAGFLFSGEYLKKHVR